MIKDNGNILLGSLYFILSFFSGVEILFSSSSSISSLLSSDNCLKPSILVQAVITTINTFFLLNKYELLYIYL